MRKERTVLRGDSAVRQASHHAAALAGGRSMLAEDAQPGAGVLSAGRARDSRIAPRRGAARAHEISRTGRQIVLRQGEERELRRTAALGAVAGVAGSTASRPGVMAERLEHWSQRGASEVAVDGGLIIPAYPAVDDPARLLDGEPSHEVSPQPVRAGGHAQ